MVRSPHQAPVGLLVAPRRFVLRPGERAEAHVALPQKRPGHRLGSLEAHPQVRGQTQLQVHALGRGDAFVVAGPGVFPVGAAAAVIEVGLAIEDDLNFAGHTTQRPQQHVVGVVVGRRTAVGVRSLVTIVMPGPDEQDIPHDDPAGRGRPARLEHHRARQVPVGRRNEEVGRAHPKPACVSIQDGAEDAGRVDTREAEPLDVAARRHQGHDLAVGEECVVPDGRERRPARRWGRGVAHASACSTASTSSSTLMPFPTRNPPVSSAWFQVTSNSSRLISPDATNPARTPPHGSTATALELDVEGYRPGDVPDREVTDNLEAVAGDRPHRRAAVGDHGVPLDVEEVGGTQMAIPFRVAGVDARRIDGHLDARLLGPLGDVKPPLELAEMPAAPSRSSCAAPRTARRECAGSIFHLPTGGSSRPSTILGWATLVSTFPLLR